MLFKQFGTLGFHLETSFRMLLRWELRCQRRLESVQSYKGSSNHDLEAASF